MDQVKIGKFIALCRKEKKLTQLELAEKLGVSDKTISNWENARCMPDLSLFKPLCDILDITINELLNGSKIKKEEYREKIENNTLNILNYTNQEVNSKNNLINYLLICFGILLTLTALTIFPSESSWSSIYSLTGLLISFLGIFKLTKKLVFKKRLIYNTLYFIISVIFLLTIDYLSVITNKQAPRFSYSKETISNMIIYKSLFYNVYQINYNTVNEYYIIDTKKEYTKDNVLNVPFNLAKSGIDNIIKYKNKYVGNNSNDINLINNLPLKEYGYTLEIDSVNLGLKINYHITDWYINNNYYLEKCLIYNSISLFSLIDNLEYINYNFSGKSYQITKDKVKVSYPYYEEIIEDGINKEKFNNYLVKRINDDSFIDNMFKELFFS